MKVPQTTRNNNKTKVQPTNLKEQKKGKPKPKKKCEKVKQPISQSHQFFFYNSQKWSFKDQYWKCTSKYGESSGVQNNNLMITSLESIKRMHIIGKHQEDSHCSIFNKIYGWFFTYFTCSLYDWILLSYLMITHWLKTILGDIYSPFLGSLSSSYFLE